MAPKRKFVEEPHPVYRGVRRKKCCDNRWVCHVKEPKKLVIGTFETPEMAARAHDVVVMAYYGRKDLLNFNNSKKLLLYLPRRVMRLNDVRRAACEMAQWFKPKCVTDACSATASSRGDDMDDVDSCCSIVLNKD